MQPWLAYATTCYPMYNPTPYGRPHTSFIYYHTTHFL